RLDDPARLDAAARREPVRPGVLRARQAGQDRVRDGEHHADALGHAGLSVARAMSGSGAELLDGSAWRAFCRRLEAIGERLQRAGFADDPRARSEGYRAITRWLAYAMQQEIENGDPRFPGFVSYQNPWNQWG